MRVHRAISTTYCDKEIDYSNGRSISSNLNVRSFGMLRCSLSELPSGYRKLMASDEG